MFWQEDDNKQEFQVPDEVQDLLFDIQCRELPVHHIHALSQALLAVLPWLADEPRAAIHEIHLAGSQNGWERPDPELGQKLILSRRTKLTLRLPKHRTEQAQAALNGVTLDIDGHPLTIGNAKSKLLSKQGTIFARNLVLAPGEAEDEMVFLQRMVAELGGRNIRVKKAMPGKTVAIHTPDGPLATRSLMIADLSAEESVALQQQALGEHRLLGCGIFLPHKGIDAVKQTGDD
jgi:CRISPR-associated protein Cas6